MVFIIVLALPITAALLVKPTDIWRRGAENDEDIPDWGFTVIVHESRGDFRYSPEEAVELMAAAQLPEEIDFIGGGALAEASSGLAHDFRQEYLRALAIVLRTNLVYVWESEGCPESLDFDDTGLQVRYLTDAEEDSAKKSEIEEAVKYTYGAVITNEKKVIAAPFFTSSQSSMFVGEAGEGVGFSLNFAYLLAKDGMDFYEILKYFYVETSTDISIEIYETRQSDAARKIFQANIR